MKTLGNESLSYSMVKKWAAEFKRGGGGGGGESEVGIIFGAVQTILTDILDMSKVSASVD